MTREPTNRNDKFVGLSVLGAMAAAQSVSRAAKDFRAQRGKPATSRLVASNMLALPFTL